MICPTEQDEYEIRKKQSILIVLTPQHPPCESAVDGGVHDGYKTPVISDDQVHSIVPDIEQVQDRWKHSSKNGPGGTTTKGAHPPAMLTMGHRRINLLRTELAGHGNGQ
jgi:hypothetical protein